jgi:probable HAF family extracellular repeat protein
MEKEAHMRRRFYAALGCVALLALTITARAPARAQTPYAITDLGNFDGGAWSNAVALNMAGQAVGSANLSGGYHATLFDDGTLEDLGTLPGGGTISLATSINASGQIVGTAYLANNSGNHGFVYQDYTMSDLGTICSSYTDENGNPKRYCGNSSASDINDQGAIVGSVNMLGGASHGVLYSNGTITDLGTLGGNGSFAMSINALGQIVGGADTAGGARHPFLYTPGQGMQDLGTLGGTTAHANAINDQGLIVGRSTTASGAVHAFLYDSGRMQDLGLLPNFPATEAFSINRAGQVVGAAKGGNGYQRSVRAFLYSDGVLSDLNTLLPANSGWVLLEARGINDAGQIVALGTHNGGAQHAALLTPQ